MPDTTTQDPAACGDLNTTPFGGNMFSPEDSELFEKMMTVVGHEESASNGKPPLEDHCVILKSKKSAPTEATRIWKEHVRFVFGKKKSLTEGEIQSLKELQDLYYRCSFGGESSVSFWIEATQQEVDLCKVGTCCYLGYVAYVPATEDCLRDEIRNNGVSAHQRRGKRKKPKNAPLPSSADRSPTATSEVPPVVIHKKFALTNSKKWKEQVTEICQAWIQESQHFAERIFKNHLVNKLEEDISSYSSYFERYSIPPGADEYDRHRQALHSSMLLDTVNKLGNGMIDWYEQDYQARHSRDAFSFGPGPSGGDGFSGERRDQGFGTGGGGGNRFDGGPAGFGPSQNMFRSSPRSPGPDHGCKELSEQSSSSSVDEDLQSWSYWTESEYDQSTSVTSILEEDDSSDLNTCVESVGRDLEDEKAASATLEGRGLEWVSLGPNESQGVTVACSPTKDIQRQTHSVSRTTTNQSPNNTEDKQTN